jgi:hypothetical protein
MSQTINKIYHPFWLWEDYKAGFYKSCSKKDKEEKKHLVSNMFSDYGLTMCYMNKVVNTWFFSCEQFLTNESINKVAYLGQAACCLYGGVPNLITMNVWSSLDDNIRDRSDFLAKRIIKKWELKRKLKNTLKNGSQKDMKKGYQMKLLLN